MSRIFRDVFPSLMIFEQRLLMGDMLRTFFQRYQLFERITVFKSTNEMELWNPSHHVPSLFLISVGEISFMDETSQYLRYQYPNVPVFCLDKRVRSAMMGSVVEHQVNGYWTLVDLTEELIQGIIDATRGNFTCCNEARPFLEMDKNRFTISPSCPEPHYFKLSRREKELYVNISRGMSLDDCSRMMSLTKKSVDNLKTRLMSKLGAHSITKVVYLAAKHGLTE